MKAMSALACGEMNVEDGPALELEKSYRSMPPELRPMLEFGVGCWYMSKVKLASMFMSSGVIASVIYRNVVALTSSS